MTKILKSAALGGMASLMVLSTASAFAVPITITIENESTENGLVLTPLFVAFHNGSYDAFDVGGTASAGTERVAEVGQTDVATQEALAADANAVVGTFGQADGFAGAPVIEPGEVATMTFDIDPNDHRFFNYLSMIIPSNDTFIGNGNSLELFDGTGTYLGDRELIIDGNRIWDAGTEVNNLSDGPAFVVGQDGAAGTEENGLVSLSNGINATGVSLPNGSILDPLLADFTSDRNAFRLATISISFDPAAVPLPGALPLMAAGLGAGAWIRRKKKATA